MNIVCTVRALLDRDSRKILPVYIRNIYEALKVTIF